MNSVAVVGLACRLPGGLDSIPELWQALLNKVNTADTVPKDRWDAERYYSDDPAMPGKGYVRRGNFLKQDFRSFDAAFFDLPPRVAENLDPQQRLMLEVVWEAFENAGLDLPAHAGRNIGVYTGGFMLDHMITMMSLPNRALINQNTAAGMMMTMLSNRVSHAFDLRGPSLSIDTACSSSLTAFNYGFQDIRSGKAEMAVIGGVNVMTRHEYPVGMCKGQFLSRDGECKSFDARGDGYGRGEGAGVVILKDYDKAVADGDLILAKVLGAGVNSDGRTPGISMPSGEAQGRLIADVCREYDIAPQSVHYVECHGTGTAIGDPTEAQSVGSVFGAGRSADKRVVIGSVKSNIGHTEAAAGVAGAIKAVLTLQNRLATPLANLIEPNPEIPFDDLGLRLPVKAVPLGTPGEALRAAVNSFGYGGTNAHVILESVPELSGNTQSAERPDFPYMLPISGRSATARSELAARYVRLMTQPDAPDPDDLTYSASQRRAHLSHRAVAIGATRDELAAALSALEAGGDHDGLVTGEADFAASDAPVFVYTGMGPQWWGMGQSLYRENAVFRDALDEADAIFRDISGFSILAELQKDQAASQIARTAFAQPGNFMVQLGLTRLLQAAGVSPGAIVGHSVGEVASAWASGVLSLKDALTVSFHRSQAQARTAGTGSMLAVGLGEAALAPYLQEFGTDLCVAAVNAPATLTVAGDSDAIRRLAAALTGDNVFNRVLQVEVPYHSHLMDPILGEIRENLAGLQPSLPAQRLFSTVTGQEVTGIAFDADYWVQNVRQPVAFMAAVTALMQEGQTNFIEIGPHPVLRSALRETARSVGKDIRLTETLRLDQHDEVRRVNRAVAQVFANGARIGWSRLIPRGRFVSLPNYPWQRERLWLESDIGQTGRVSSTAQPLLGIRGLSADQMWYSDLNHDAVAYLAQHVVGGASVMPAAGYLETLFELGRQTLPDGAMAEIRDARIKAPLVMQPGRAVEYTTLFDPETGMAQIRSAEPGSIGADQLHMSARIGMATGAAAGTRDIGALLSGFDAPRRIEDFYRDLSASGLAYGPAFRPVTELRLHPNGREAMARLDLRPEFVAGLDRYALHPTLLDGAFQMLIGILNGDEGMYLPTGFRTIRLLSRTPAQGLWCHGRVTSRTARHIECDLALYDDDGTLVCSVHGMEATASTGHKPVRLDRWGDPVRLLALEQVWTPAAPLSEPKRVGSWLILRDQREGIADRVLPFIEAQGTVVPRIATIGDDFRDQGRDTTIRPGNEEDIARLVEAAGPVDGVLIACGLDATADSDDPTGEQAIATMIALGKAIALKPVAERPRIYVLTRSAYACDRSDTAVEPAQRAINGFVRVAHNELEGCAVTSVDLPARISDRIIDSLWLELLSDAAEDEVALRGRRRLYSEFAESDVLSQPVMQERKASDGDAVMVRPASGDTAPGMVELTHVALDSPGQGDIRLRVLAMSLPASLLESSGSASFDQSFMQVVAQVAAVGAGVADLPVGAVVFGYVPADFASHLQGPRGSFHLEELPAGTSYETALDALSAQVIAAYATDSSCLVAGDSALTLASDGIAVAVAAMLTEAGVSVHLLGANDAPATTAALDALVARTGRFDAIIAPMGDWMRRFGDEALIPGGILIDTSTTASPILAPEQASNIVRTSLDVVTGRGRQLRAALRRVAGTLTGGHSGSKSLSINLSDLVLRRLDVVLPDLRIDVLFDLDRVPVPVAVSRAPEFSSAATYLVTGGLGGFGQETARWLADHGARHLVLASRSGANTDDKRAFVAELEAMGIRVATPCIDLSDSQRVAGLIDEIGKGSAPLKGVFHTAAVIEDEDLATLDLASYRQVMRSKAQSAHALDRATAHLELDWFVLYSSVANMVGNKRQVSYSAANGFLDGLAWARRKQGKCGTSINWGAIGGAGMLTQDEATEQFLKYMGIRALDVHEALRLMHAAMERDLTQVGIMLLSSWADWARYETIGAASPRFTKLLAADASVSQGGSSEVRERLIAELAELNPAERLDTLTGLIKVVIARELHAEADNLPVDRALNELGIDSLMAAEIQMQLETSLAIPVTVMDILGAATIRSICDQALGDFGFIEPIAAE
ncbi:SDR family NAD(P)-dependent oxidoreductase [Paracoccus sp. (in: a-proteobacteria)]|uniref:type I polyketide synthase n=1 Tax=Paracoccus sp. TaxID=267 RepID=UPI003A87E518